MERKIENTLKIWKESQDRLPLIVQGSRQVGKTYSILGFGKTFYSNVLYFNFESNRDLHQIFERNLSPEIILRELSILAGEHIVKTKSLIFFDEIQACERALSSLKYFAEQSPEYHIIAAGSLLGVAINRQNYSFPVGKVKIVSMHPFDFEEFLWAWDKKDAASLIREYFNSNKPCSLHQQFIDWYKTFLCVGGMPQVINEFIKSGDFNFVLALQNNIMDAYIADMAKYTSPHETVRIMSVFKSLPAQLAKENTKFQYKLIKTGARASVYEGSLDWLKASGIVNISYKVTTGKLPLTAYEEQSSFKVYLADSGLLCSRYGIPVSSMLSNFVGYNEIKGSLAENYVSSALVSNNYNPYYWESQGKAEVDFVIQNKKGQVLPIEVKSSENVRAKSLQQYIKTYNPDYAIRISTKNFGFENNIKSVPLYAVYCI